MTWPRSTSRAQETICSLAPPHGLDLHVHVDEVEVPVRGVADREVAAAIVEVHHLAQRQLTAVVEVGTGELGIAQLGRLEAP